MKHRIICRRKLINASPRIWTGNTTHHGRSVRERTSVANVAARPRYLLTRKYARTPTSAGRVGFNFGTDFERLITPPRGRRRIYSTHIMHATCAYVLHLPRTYIHYTGWFFEHAHLGFSLQQRHSFRFRFSSKIF